MRVSVLSAVSGELFEINIDDATCQAGKAFECLLQQIAAWKRTPALCLQLACDGTVLRNEEDLRCCQDNEVVKLVAFRSFEPVRLAMEREPDDDGEDSDDSKREPDDEERDKELKQSAVEALTQLVEQADSSLEISVVHLLDYVMRRMDAVRSRCSHCPQMIAQGAVILDPDDCFGARRVLLTFEQRVQVLRLTMKLMQKGSSCAADSLMRYATSSEHHGRIRQVLKAVELEGERGSHVAMSLVKVGFEYNAEGWVRSWDYGLKNCITEAAVRCLGKVAPLKDSDTTNALLAFLADEDYNIQLAAAEALLHLKADDDEDVRRRCVEVFAYLVNLCIGSGSDVFRVTIPDRFEDTLFSATQNMIENTRSLVRLTALEALTSTQVARFRTSNEWVKSAVKRCLKDPAWEVRCEAVNALSRMSSWAGTDTLELWVEMVSAAFKDPDQQVVYALMETIHKVAGADDERTAIASTFFLEVQKPSAAAEYLQSLSSELCCDTGRRGSKHKGKQKLRLSALEDASGKAVRELTGSNIDAESVKAADGSNGYNIDTKTLAACALSCFNEPRNPCDTLCYNREGQIDLLGRDGRPPSGKQFAFLNPRIEESCFEKCCHDISDTYEVR